MVLRKRYKKHLIWDSLSEMGGPQMSYGYVKRADNVNPY